MMIDAKFDYTTTSAAQTGDFGPCNPVYQNVTSGFGGLLLVGGLLVLLVVMFRMFKQA